MGVLKRVARGAVVPAVALGVLVAGTGTAAANDFGIGVHAEGHFVFYTATDDSYLKVCLYGHVEPTSRVYGVWRLLLHGAKGTQQIAEEWSTEALDVNTCRTVYKDGYETGWFTVDWSYTAVGSYIYARETGAAMWDPHTGNQVFSVRT